MDSYLLKAPDMGPWRAAAKREGLSFAEWLRRAAEQALEGGQKDKAHGSAVEVRPRPRYHPQGIVKPKARVSTCPHRIPPEAYCKECDR